MAETIAFVLRNLPVFLFVAALALALVRRTGASGPNACSGGYCSCPSASRACGRRSFISFFRKSQRRTLAGRSVRSSSRWAWRILRLARRLA